MNTDKEGRVLNFDVREDEEQFRKFEEIIEILCAAGYFRARIKGLKDFDKIVGGMTWCIKMTNTDIDIDLMFEENLSIGQKIALTEKIVQVLKRMKCPYALEPHQIQGMDSIHIFPVIQWLVKKSIEYGQENEAAIRSFAINMFNKEYSLPIDEREQNLNDKAKNAIKANDPDQEPVRKYRHTKKSSVLDEATNVQITILEYKGSLFEDNVDDLKDKNTTDSNQSQNQNLMNKMNQEVNTKISASVVGSVVSEKSQEIEQLAKEFIQNQKMINENSLEYKKNDLTAKLKKIKKEIAKSKKMCNMNSEMHATLKAEISKTIEKQKKLKPINDVQSEKEREEKKLLYIDLDRLKKKKKTLSEQFKEEEMRLERDIKNISSQEFESEHEKEMKVQLEKEKERVNRLKPQLVKKSKQLAILQRKLDDIPSRDELNQYQKRFLELYNQVAAKQNETKKFFMLYNQLDDTLIHLDKELSLMGSILNNFNQAMMSTQSSKDQFLSQFEQIVANIKSAKMTLEKKERGEKVKKDQLNEAYLASIEKKRLYYKAVKEFKEEIRLNEILSNKLSQI